MDLKIIKKQDNPLLSRTEIKAEINFFNEPTPKKEDVQKKISAMEKADEKLVVIKNIHTSFSSGKANVLAYVYKSEDELKKIEPKKKEKKKAKAEGDVKEGEEASKEKAKEAPKSQKSKISEGLETKSQSEEAKEASKKEDKEKPKKEAPKEETKKE